MRQEIRIAGFGGQGVVLAGYMLGKALALYSGWEAVMTQSHGPEARGGASSADLVLSTEPIAYPFVQQRLVRRDPDEWFGTGDRRRNCWHPICS